MDEMKKLSSLFSDLCPASNFEDSSVDLRILEESLKCIVPRCLTCSPVNWSHDANGSASDLYLSFFESCKRIYQQCSYIVRASSGFTESLKTILNMTYELQCFFVGAMPRCEGLRNDLYNSSRAKKFCLILFEVCNSADKLDPRISLPLWKLVSSVMQQYKNELNKASTASTNVLVHGDSTESSNNLDFMLIHLLDSVQYFMKECLQKAKVSDSTTTSANTNIKMLNLLNRIATFCIREFATNSLTSKDDSAGIGLVKWLQWMIKTRYCGGFYASGTGLPKQLTETLESSTFLAIDVAIGHLLSLPIDQYKECSVAVNVFRHQDITPVVKCRIYGTLMAGLARQPQFYPRWFNDDFNVLGEFFAACAQLHFQHTEDDSSGFDPLKRLCAVTDEFYTTLLAQICACVCGLTAGCFTYLESALLSALLSEHHWTVMLATDVWCFLARYGTGELCWQYATTFAEAIYRSACQIFQDSQAPGCADSDVPVLSSLTRLGWLLARLIVFLTPKQQAEFLRTYPLSAVTVTPDNEPVRSVLWWFVPLEMDRLQKVAQSLARDCLTERIAQFSFNDQSHGPSAILNAIDAASLLYLIETSPTSWREANATGIAQLCVFTVAQLQAVSDSRHALPCATWLAAAARRPVSALVGHLSRFNLHSSYLALASTSPMSQLLQWFLTVMSPDAESIPPGAPCLSFTVLRSWYIWVVSSEPQFPTDTGGDTDRSDPMWMRHLCSLLRRVPMDSIDAFLCRPIVESLNQKLAGVQPCEKNANESATIPSADIQALENAFNLIERKFKSGLCLCSADVTVLRRLTTQLSALLNSIDRMECN